MTRIALLISAVLLAFIPAAAEAAKPPTCRSGTTVYEQGGVRVFLDDRDDERWYACGPSTDKPRLLWSVQPPYGAFEVTTRIGDKLIFEGEGWGEGGGENTSVGWFDARTSEVRLGELAGGVSNKPYEVVVAADGSLGLVVGAEEAEFALRVGYLARSSTPGALQPELVLATPGRGRVKGSLAFADADRTLTWALDDGGARRLPVTGEAVTCTSGTTLVEAGGTRVFEVLPARKTARGFQADVLAACPPGATTPRELAVSDVYDQDHWDVLASGRTGERVAFRVGWSGIGLVDGTTGEVRFVEPRNITGVKDVAVSAAGEVVFTGMETIDGHTSKFVARLTNPTATSFRGWERLATLGGEDTETGSFAVTEDARVIWRVEDGLPQSIPLAGETVAGCGSGTTLIERDGLRVAEWLPARARHAQLLACVPGAVTPVPLLRGPRHASWAVTEVSRKGGRVAVYAASEGHLDWDHVVGFAAGWARAFEVDGERLSARSIRDAAVRLDGRVAVAVRSSKRWRVSLLRNGRERVLARPRDGLRVGSLWFTADSRQVQWRNRAGRWRQVPVR